MPKKETATTLSIDGREVRVSNPDKPYFSGEVKLSKLDVVRYYLSVSDASCCSVYALRQGQGCEDPFISIVLLPIRFLKVGLRSVVIPATVRVTRGQRSNEVVGTEARMMHGYNLP